MSNYPSFWFDLWKKKLTEIAALPRDFSEGEECLEKTCTTDVVKELEITSMTQGPCCSADLQSRNLKSPRIQNEKLNNKSK